MAFVLRTTERLASGREVVRAVRVDQPALTVGRGSDRDLVLPDLLLALDHARLERGDGARLLVLATAGMPIDVEGASTERATIDLARGGEVRLGTHRLLIRRDEAGDILIDIARAGDVAHSIGGKDERTLFALGSALPSRRPLAWALAAAVLLAFLAWPVWHFYGRADAVANPHAGLVADASWSPGKLSNAHAGLENNCRACHDTPFVAVRDDSCRSCHQSVHDHAPPARLAAAMPALGVGERLNRRIAMAFNRPPGRCVDCHTEHQGATAMAPTPQKFCADCHGTLKQQLPDTPFGDATDFAKGHPQFRPAVLVRSDPRPVFERISLDDAPKQDGGLTFPHALHLSTTNAVAQMAVRQGQARAGKAMDCADCHVSDARGGFAPVSMEANCQSCHSLAFARSDGTVRTLRHGDPRQVVAELRDFYALRGPVRPMAMEGGRRRPGDFAADSMAATYGRAVAARAGGGVDRSIRAVFSPGGACYDCHVVEPPARAGSLAFRIRPVVQQTRYFAHGWFDHRAHAGETCASCHAAPTSTSARDVLLPKIAQCRTCHAGAEPARGQIKSTCAMCHVYHQDPGGVVADIRRRRATPFPPSALASGATAR
ncbi:cytochrome c3 family protein [Sphingomonas adhaesiva]|uniref:cytochrome c3 family protein n=1 Tax=Sphingomonas adhaesiva TaxID=28212 RepID=UPI002FF83E7B